MQAILDTSVLITADVPPLDGELAISAAALADLHFGVLVTSDPATRAEQSRRRSDVQRRFSARLYTRNAGGLAGIEGLVEIVPV